jgi:hypothetical protein
MTTFNKKKLKESNAGRQELAKLKPKNETGVVKIRISPPRK